MTQSVAALAAEIANLRAQVARLHDEKKDLEERAAVLRARFLKKEASARSRRP